MSYANKDIQKPPGKAGASHNSGERDSSVMTDSSSGGAVQCDAKELRARARLAWNNWPDTEASRREISTHEARDPISAASWDRVIDAILAVRLDEAAIRKDEREPTSEMLLAGARSIGNSMGADNFMVRAKSCWDAMQAARMGTMEPRPAIRNGGKQP